MTTGKPVSIRTKFLWLTGITVLSLVVLFAVVLATEKSLLMQDRQEKVRNLVEVAHGLVAHYDKQVQAGKLSKGRSTTMRSRPRTASSTKRRPKRRR